MTQTGDNEVVQLFTGDTTGIEAAAAKAVEQSVRAAQQMEAQAKRAADTQLQIEQRAAAARAEVRAREFEANGRQLQADLARVAAAYDRQIRIAQSAAERESLVKLRAMDVQRTIAKDRESEESIFGQAQAKWEAKRAQADAQAKAARRDAIMGDPTKARAPGQADDAGGLLAGGFSVERALRVGGAIMAMRVAIEAATAAQAAWNAKAAENAGNIEKAHEGYLGIVQTIQQIPAIGQVIVGGVELLTGQLEAIRKIREEMELIARTQNAMLDSARQLKTVQEANAAGALDRARQIELLNAPLSERGRMAVENEGNAAVEAAQRRQRAAEDATYITPEQAKVRDALRLQQQKAEEEAAAIATRLAEVVAQHNEAVANGGMGAGKYIERIKSELAAKQSDANGFRSQADKIDADARALRETAVGGAKTDVDQQKRLAEAKLREFDRQAAVEHRAVITATNAETMALRLDLERRADEAAVERMRTGFDAKIAEIRNSGKKQADIETEVAAMLEQKRAALANLAAQQERARVEKHAAAVAQATQLDAQANGHGLAGQLVAIEAQRQAALRNAKPGDAQEAADINRLANAQRNAALMGAVGGPDATADLQAQTRIAALQLAGQSDPQAAIAAQIVASQTGFDRQIREKQKLMEDAKGTPAADAIKAQIEELQKQSQIAAASIVQGSFTPARFVGLGDAWKQIQSNAAGGKADIDKKMLDAIEKYLPDILKAAERQTAIGGF